MKKWHILYDQRNTFHQLSTDDDIFHILLENRGLSGEKEIKKFLFPSLDDITIETVGIKTKDVEKAKKRIRSAIEKKESIVVYADYDVDGVTSCAIVWETIHNLGAQVMPYIPHRVEEGYGLSIKGIDYIREHYNPVLILTVDCGVSAVEEIAYARKFGIETIILDHHILPEKLPHYFALIHTTKMTASGIAWFFSYILASFLAGGGKTVEKKKHLDLAVLGTIADLIPLIGINRILVKYGLEELNKTKRIGLRALMKESGLEETHIGVYEVSHILSPRINAMGRLKHALDALRLLCTQDIKRADTLARVLHTTNKERQILTENATLHALSTIKTNMFQNTKLLFISSELYQEGIIGLVAGKLVEEFYRPAIVISRGKEYSKASARSIAGFNIVEAIKKTSALLVSVGGHPMAAGFTVATKNIDILKGELISIAQKDIKEDMMSKILKIDIPIPLSFVTKSLHNKIQQLAPFGVGNPEPVFVSYRVKVIQARLVGKEGKHLKLTLLQNEGNKGSIYETYEAIGFGMGTFLKQIKRDTFIDIVYSINENTWKEKQSLQLKLKDVAMSHFAV